MRPQAAVCRNYDNTLLPPLFAERDIDLQADDKLSEADTGGAEPAVTADNFEEGLTDCFERAEPSETEI